MTIALVDCNSFYSSCERVFHPETRGRPVIVLSNNDGCAIAYSQEAKQIGFGQMCEPFFQTKDRIKKHNVAVFSSNYTLYDDMSKRVMTILGNYTPRLEVYSIDEAFLSLHGMEHIDLQEYGEKIRKDILKMTGIPVGVGISRTKVLSKIANKLSKKNSGVYLMLTDEEIDSALRDYPVGEIWGIGRASVSKLSQLKIRTAYDLKMYKDDQCIQKLLTKTGREIQDELRGIPCLTMEDVTSKHNIANTRSFRYDITDKRELQEAIATFASKAAEKLREQKSVCSSVTVFTHTNQFKDQPQYFAIDTATLVSGTADTIKIIKTAHQILDRIYKPEFSYKKGGVILNHIVPQNENQMDLFNSGSAEDSLLSATIDAINNKFGPKTIKSLACGIEQPWITLADHKSRRFTTNWKEILSV